MGLVHTLFLLHLPLPYTYSLPLLTYSHLLANAHTLNKVEPATHPSQSSHPELPPPLVSVQLASACPAGVRLYKVYSLLQHGQLALL